MRGEEQAIAIALPESALALEGIYVAGAGDDAPGALIAPPHPLYGGSMESPVVSELEHAATRAGHASVRFNWRGVGASAGEPSGEAKDADADVTAALAVLAETVSGPLVAAGYSFGAGAVLRASRSAERLERLVLVAPPPDLLDLSALARFPGSMLVVVGEADRIASAEALAPLVGSRPRTRLVTVPEADHFFAVGLSALGAAVVDWLGRE